MGLFSNDLDKIRKIIQDMNKKNEQTKRLYFCFFNHQFILFMIKNINENISRSDVGISDGKINIVQNLFNTMLFLKPSEAFLMSLNINTN